MRPGLLALLVLPYAVFGALLAIALSGVVLPWVAVVGGTLDARAAFDASVGSAFFACSAALALFATESIRRRRGISFRHPRPAARTMDV